MDQYRQKNQNEVYSTSDVNQNRAQNSSNGNQENQDGDTQNYTEEELIAHYKKSIKYYGSQGIELTNDQKKIINKEKENNPSQIKLLEMLFNFLSENYKIEQEKQQENENQNNDENEQNIDNNENNFNEDNNLNNNNNNNYQDPIENSNPRQQENDQNNDFDNSKSRRSTNQSNKRRNSNYSEEEDYEYYDEPVRRHRHKEKSRYRKRRAEEDSYSNYSNDGYRDNRRKKKKSRSSRSIKRSSSVGPGKSYGRPYAREYEYNGSYQQNPNYSPVYGDRYQPMIVNRGFSPAIVQYSPIQQPVVYPNAQNDINMSTSNSIFTSTGTFSPTNLSYSSSNVLYPNGPNAYPLNGVDPALYSTSPPSVILMPKNASKSGRKKSVKKSSKKSKERQRSRKDNYSDEDEQEKKTIKGSQIADQQQNEKPKEADQIKMNPPENNLVDDQQGKKQPGVGVNETDKQSNEKNARARSYKKRKSTKEAKKMARSQMTRSGEPLYDPQEQQIKKEEPKNKLQIKEIAALQNTKGNMENKSIKRKVDPKDLDREFIEKCSKAKDDDENPAIRQKRENGKAWQKNRFYVDPLPYLSDPQKESDDEPDINDDSDIYKVKTYDKIRLMETIKWKIPENIFERYFYDDKSPHDQDIKKIVKNYDIKYDVESLLNSLYSPNKKK